MLTMENLISFGCISSEAAEYLRACVGAGVNILVSGGESSGKSTFLNILASFIPDGAEHNIIGMIETPEDMPVLQVTTGCDGIMASIAADTPAEATAKLQAMLCEVDPSLATSTACQMVASGFALVAQVMRVEDGSRKVMHIAEANCSDGTSLQFTDVFLYQKSGVVEGKVQGETVATGHVPGFASCLV